MDSLVEQQVKSTIKPLKSLAKNSRRFLNKAEKPDYKEFTKIAGATAVGILVMGFIGFFVKLIHIPINSIIVGA